MTTKTSRTGKVHTSKCRILSGLRGFLESNKMPFRLFFLDDGALNLVIIEKVKLVGLVISHYRVCFRLFGGGARWCVDGCTRQSGVSIGARTEGGGFVIAASYLD